MLPPSLSDDSGFPDLSGLDADATLTLAEEVLLRRRRAEVDDLRLVAHWAALNSADPRRTTDGRRAWSEDRLVEVGGEGSPKVRGLTSRSSTGRCRPSSRQSLRAEFSPWPRPRSSRPTLLPTPPRSRPSAAVATSRCRSPTSRGSVTSSPASRPATRCGSTLCSSGSPTSSPPTTPTTPPATSCARSPSVGSLVLRSWWRCSKADVGRGQNTRDTDARPSSTSISTRPRCPA